MSNMNSSQIQIHLLLLQILRFQTIFADNTNACGQRERDTKAGQAEVRGGVGGNRRGDNEGARVHWPKTKAGHQ